MNLRAMMSASGLGCGENCRCAALLVEMLDPMQAQVFAHMLKHGAEVRRDAVVKAETAEPPPSFMDMMANLFAEAAAEDTLKANTVPYEGELGAELDAAIAACPQDVRQEAELFIREFIAEKADGDPNRVFFQPLPNGNFGLGLKEGDEIIGGEQAAHDGKQDEAA